MNSKLTDEGRRLRNESICAEYRDGATTGGLAAKWKITNTRVLQILAANGVPVRPRQVHREFVT